MRKPSTTVGLALGATLLAAGFTGCAATGPTSSTEWGSVSTTVSTTASSSSHPTPESQVAPDYGRLLIRPGDISGSADTFVTRSTLANPAGLDGVEALFVNQDDTRAIGVTILLLPDPAAATTTLNATIGSIDTIVTGDSPRPSSVGTGGTVVSGTSPDGSKELTVLLFTEGRAVARLEFASAPGDPTPAQLVADIGTMQEIALRSGL